MRGLDNRDSAQLFMDGERFYYNNIRPHMGLDGKTPAQMAGLSHVPVEDNPWMTFLRVALAEKKRIARRSVQ